VTGLDHRVGKGQSDFPIPERENAYLGGYQGRRRVPALAGDRPGTRHRPARLNRAMREQGETDPVFEAMTGELPPSLWAAVGKADRASHSTGG